MPILAVDADVQDPGKRAADIVVEGRPGAVIRLTAEQLIELRDPAFKSAGLDTDAIRKAVAYAQREIPAVQAARSPVIAPGATDATTHETFGFRQALAELRHSLAGAPVPGTATSLPPELEATRASLDQERAAREARNLFIIMERVATGEDPNISRSDINNILAHATPQHANLVAVKFVDQVLAYNNNALEGFTAEKTAALVRMRTDFNRSGPELVGSSAEETKAITEAHNNALKEYPKLCLEYLSGKLALASGTLGQHAALGMDTQKAAVSLAELIHGINKGKDTTAQLQEKIGRITSNASPAQINEIKGHYNSLGEEQSAKTFFDILLSVEATVGEKQRLSKTEFNGRGEYHNFAREKDFKIRELDKKLDDYFYQAVELLGSASRSDILNLETRVSGLFANCSRSNVNVRNILLEFGSKEAARYNMLLEGHDPDSAVRYINGAVNGAGTNEEQIYIALRWVPDRKANGEFDFDSKGKTALTTEQWNAIKSTYAATDPNGLITRLNDEQLFAAFGKLRERVQGVDTNQSLNTALTYNFDLDFNPHLPVILAGSLFGSDSLAAIPLHKKLMDLDDRNPNPEHVKEIMRLLEHGSDVGTRFLNPVERTILGQAHDELNPETPLEKLIIKLPPDQKAQAELMKIYNFCPAEHAAEVVRDVSHIGQMTKGWQTLEDYALRITQVDKVLQERYNTNLEEAVKLSSLSANTKENLLVTVYAPKILELHDKLVDDKLVDRTATSTVNDADLNRLVVASPAFVQAYDVFSDKGFYADLYTAAENSKLSWESVALQQARVFGLTTPETTQLEKLFTGRTTEINLAGIKPDRIPHLMQFASIPYAGRLHQELGAERPRIAEIDRLTNSPMLAPVILATHSAMFKDYDLVDQFKTVALGKQLNGPTSAKILLRFSGLDGHTYDQLLRQLDPQNPTIATKDSVFRGKSPEQAKALVDAHDFAVAIAAKEAGQTEFGDLNELLISLANANKLDVPAALTTIFLRKGVDPFDITKSIGQDPVSTIGQLRTLNKDMLIGLHKLCRENKAGSLLKAVMQTPGADGAFKDEAERVSYHSALIETLYSPAAIGAATRLVDAIVQINKSDTSTDIKKKAVNTLVTEITAHASAQLTDIQELLNAQQAGRTNVLSVVVEKARTDQLLDDSLANMLATHLSK